MLCGFLYFPLVILNSLEHKIKISCSEDNTCSLKHKIKTSYFKEVQDVIWLDL